MDRRLLLAALRVLSGLCATGQPPAAADIHLLRVSALSDEQDLALDDLARTIARRAMGCIQTP
jgi:hypothetical protein